jgi:hypothetical protein
MAEQASKLYQRIQNEPDDLRKNMTLMNLYDRNEHLFFYVLLHNIEGMPMYILLPTRFLLGWTHP